MLDCRTSYQRFTDLLSRLSCLSLIMNLSASNALYNPYPTPIEGEGANGYNCWKQWLIPLSGLSSAGLLPHEVLNNLLHIKFEYSNKQRSYLKLICTSHISRTLPAQLRHWVIFKGPFYTLPLEKACDWSILSQVPSILLVFLNPQPFILFDLFCFCIIIFLNEIFRYAKSRMGLRSKKSR